MLFGIDFSIASDSFLFGQKTVYHVFGKSDGIAEFFHSQHFFEQWEPVERFFKNGVQS